MPLGKTADILMYAPFVSVYGVPEEIHKKLTKDAFLGKNGCYVGPDFDRKCKELIEMRNGQVALDDMTGDDWPVSVSELLDELKQGKLDQAEFDRWLETNGDGVFKILGDAGTGKSTFIHYLQWSKRDILWHILDLKKSIPEIKVYGSSIIIPREYFVSLHGKILSAIILEIRNFLFEKVEENNNHTQCRKRIQELLLAIFVIVLCMAGIHTVKKRNMRLAEEERIRREKEQAIKREEYWKEVEKEYVEFEKLFRENEDDLQRFIELS